MNTQIINTQRTQGQWIVANSGGTIICHNGIRYEQICLLEKTPLKITPEVEANAKLIAASPDLLKAAKLCESITDRLPAIKPQDRNAEAKKEYPVYIQQYY